MRRLIPALLVACGTAAAGEVALPGIAGVPAGSADHFIMSKLGRAPRTTTGDEWRLCYFARSRSAYVVLEFDGDSNGSGYSIRRAPRAPKGCGHVAGKRLDVLDDGIALGMDRASVESKMGPPTSKEPGDDGSSETWEYRSETHTRLSQSERSDSAMLPSESPQPTERVAVHAVVLSIADGRVSGIRVYAHEELSP
jgi:hypothetical protein